MPMIKPATIAPAAPQQYKQPSRKGKKAWRKNVDVSEIQEGLEQVRDEEIKGGIIAEKASHELFTLDTAGDADIKKRYVKSSKPLKADEIIAQRSAVPAVSIRKRANDATTDGIVPPKRQRTSYVTHKELTRLRKIADGRTEDVIDSTDPVFDPWDAERDALDQVQDPQFSFLEKPKKKVAPSTLKHKPISLAANGKSVPAVIKPEGGHSYNPIYNDYAERIMTEGDREVAAEMKRLEKAEAERLKEEAAARSAAEAEAAEARADLSEWEEDTDWEGIESGTEEVNSKVKRPERKTKSQRNKAIKRKEEERRAKHLAKQKAKDEQAAHIKKIAKELVEKEASKALAVVEDDGDESSEIGDDLELRRRKLGKIPLPEKQLELVLPDELQDSLRLLKPEGNLLKDRYRSILVRGKLESRRPVSFAKKAKKKMTEKWSYKDFVLH